MGMSGTLPAMLGIHVDVVLIDLLFGFHSSPRSSTVLPWASNARILSSPGNGASSSTIPTTSIGVCGGVGVRDQPPKEAPSRT